LIAQNFREASKSSAPCWARLIANSNFALFNARHAVAEKSDNLSIANILCQVSREKPTVV